MAQTTERLGVSQHSLYAWKRQRTKVVSDDAGRGIIQFADWRRNRNTTFSL
ncbi:hypothetical protein [Novosphingobium sp. 9]|uniref:hypothetical protein n=1 Tax=Novosphingobium sp. 9 TaxID=2025349 RepID=UPI0021B6B35B|nr:hypothetical protein [Novosphingobium sp. 9]